MKIYFWDEVLCFWRCGFVVVMAHSLDEALAIAKAQLTSWQYLEIRDVDPEVYEEPVAFACEGEEG